MSNTKQCHTVKEVIESIDRVVPKQGQRQDCFDAQVRDVIAVAQATGCADLAERLAALQRNPVTDADLVGSIEHTPLVMAETDHQPFSVPVELQLGAVLHTAVRIGCYDAADWILEVVLSGQAPSRCR